MTENNRQDIKLISNIVEVRTCAIAIAVGTNNAKLYAAAVANDNQRLLDILDDLIDEAEAAVTDKEAKLLTSATLIKHILTMARLRNNVEGLDLLVEVRDMAKANVAQLRSNEGLRRTSTETLLWLLKEHDDAKKEAASAQAS